MKKLLPAIIGQCLIALVISVGVASFTPAPGYFSRVTATEPVSAQGGVSASGVLGADGYGRYDAQIEARNSAPGHALVSVFQSEYPGSTNEEGAITFGAYESNGAINQVGALSARWARAASGNLVGLLNLHATFAASSTDEAVRIFANNGVVFWGPNDTTFPGGRQIQIYRQPGYASMVGNAHIVIDAAPHGAAPGNVFLNAYNGGDVVMGLGGGDVQMGRPIVGMSEGPSNPSVQFGWMRLKDSTGALVWVPVWK